MSKSLDTRLICIFRQIQSSDDSFQVQFVDCTINPYMHTNIKMKKDVSGTKHCQSARCLTSISISIQTSNTDSFHGHKRWVIEQSIHLYIYKM